ncbi:MAG TPA: hypothetical protein VKA46_27230 [Gemmataceae bacterium]|nr:hypothetical protein [Gemmataceae bacterium]
MLENGALLLRPCAAFPGAAAEGEAAALEPARAVLDALTGAPRGFAGWRRRGRLWPRWLSRPVLAVHESDDAPLLFTVHGLWGLAARWEVRDADGNVLGVLCGPLIKDRFGRNLALWERSAGDVGRARDGDGRELMTVMATPEGTRVAFAAGAEGNPFLKMLLLAAALVEPLAA